MENRETRKIGSGITEREELAPLPANSDNGEAIQKAFRTRNLRLFSAWGANKHVIDRARLRLNEYEKEVADLGVEFEAYNVYFKPRNSLGWYLREIVACATVAETAVDQGRPWEAVEQGLLIGEFLTELKMKALWEDFALAGQKHLGASLRSAEERRAQSANERYECVKLHRKAGHSWENCYRLAAKKFGVSASTIKQDCLPIKKLDNTID